MGGALLSVALAVGVLAGCGGVESDSSLGAELSAPVGRGQGEAPLIPVSPVSVTGSATVELAGEQPVVISGHDSVIVAGGSLRHGDTARPSLEVMRLDRASKQWTNLPPVPKGFYVHNGAFVGGEPLLVASPCPDRADVYRWNEQCLGDQVLMLDPGQTAWEAHQVPRSDKLSSLSTDTAGATGTSTLAMIPQSIGGVGAVLFDAKTKQFTTVAPPGDGGAAVPAAYCVTGGGVFIDAGAHPQGGTPSSGGSVWILDGNKWRGPAAVPAAQLGRSHGVLCTPSAFHYLGSDRSFRVSIEGTAGGTTQAPPVDGDVRGGFVVARSPHLIYATKTTGDLVALRVPPSLSDDAAVVGSAQVGSTLDFLTLDGASGHTYKIWSVEVPK